ncbi:prepilin-type N-terminal cleavage/methylation domain-containing protein [Evansella sp. AB-P1]|uniref:PilW family protein n=1 Tax=Evansella sp. AB-P1 TaxID=3037653 RepID=UPI002420242D|nr:prepilin-type N-terminal cleavage/methylation domain-containing protein [Evansella sp. AB-P1]MDG5786867.1 prepilin-type N-terminal cleavage/methylation domain-containing protein [Evansella sp. AB-P1]
MKKIKNQKGVTLVELLISVAIASIVLLLATSIYLFGQNQLTSQTEHVKQQDNVRLGMNIITKAIRSADSDVVEVVDDTTLKIDEDEYRSEHENQRITVNGQPLIDGIIFQIINPQNGRVDITIKSMPDETVSHTTTIFLRE